MQNHAPAGQKSGAGKPGPDHSGPFLDGDDRTEQGLAGGNPFDERIALIKALKYPDIVIPQRSLDHSDKVKKLNFDVFVVGDDWTGKYDYLKELGVDVVYFPYGAGVSSTNLKQKIYENFENMKKKTDNHFTNDIDVREKK